MKKPSTVRPIALAVLAFVIGFVLSVIILMAVAESLAVGAMYAIAGVVAALLAVVMFFRARVSDSHAGRCPHCHSTNIVYQTETDTELKEQHHSVLWWIFVGWWYSILKILFVPFVLLLGKNRKYKLEQSHHSVGVCQDCGHRFRVEEY